MKVTITGVFKYSNNSDIYFARKECVTKEASTEILLFNILTKEEIKNSL